MHILSLTQYLPTFINRPLQTRYRDVSGKTRRETKHICRRQNNLCIRLSRIQKVKSFSVISLKLSFHKKKLNMVFFNVRTSLFLPQRNIFPCFAHAACTSTASIIMQCKVMYLFKEEIRTRRGEKNYDEKNRLNATKNHHSLNLRWPAFKKTVKTPI